MKRYHLTSEEIQVLKILYKIRKAVSVDEIASKTQLYSDILTLIEWLLNKGYVEEPKLGYYKITMEGKKLLIESKELLKGSIIGRRYVLQEFLGEGAYGQVWKALDTKVEERVVAVKLIHEKLRGFERLKKEANALAKAQGKPDSILVFHDVGRDTKGVGKGGWLVTEFIEAPTLHRYLVNMAIKRRWLSFEEAKVIIERCLEAIVFAHSKNVVHGDIKPANIFLLGKNKIKLGDFGVARILKKAEKDERKTYPSGYKRRLGSITYMAPEVLKGETPSVQSDLFSVGILAYLLSTGQHPFLHESGLISIPELIKNEEYKPPQPGRLKRDIPKKHGDIIMNLLEKKKDKRKYKDAETVLNEWRG